VSKNVAVFVDVANIFYAAKAAGVDIDYVTLLRSATAGRDFVRAYAYTGLDPENENQRQFHSFLARSGYRVVSKDIRKYGDGRIKANLDIELVVDMMRMAEHLDIAVVVSGDGDFAPAIRAVQQMGVRVEVISFRGNTSSDLIDVADVFIDIGQVARVEKGARSGRRVATEGDLSMTEVPDKETGVTPRRRRPRRGEIDERAERSIVEVVGSHGDAAIGLVALPGEKLSRATFDGPGAQGGPSEDGFGQDLDDDSHAAAGDRRRRRRGGRGRGRGARPAGEPVGGQVPADEGTPADEPAGSTFADEVPTLPQHSGFGSVWDSQIGMSPRAASGMADVEGLDDEPEVPEYLLAEKRQQGRRRGGGRTRGGSSGYRSAIDRERFGAGAGSAGYGNRGGGRGQGAQPRWSPDAPERPVRRTTSAEPWSEVPPDVQELLRAEVTRRQGGASAAAPASPATSDVEPRSASSASSRGVSLRASAASEVMATSASAESSAAAAAAAAKPRRTPTRRKAASADATAATQAAGPAEPEVVEKPRRTTTRRKAAGADATPATQAAEPAAAEPAAAPKPRRTPTRRKAASTTESPGAEEG
jgi:uncharacterized LabA/DUF88 family protein